MPTYDYACNDCGHIFEKFHSMTETPELECPQCNSKQVKKKIGAGSGIIFKGSGFYVTDYKKKDGGSSTNSSKPAETKAKETTTSAKTSTT